MPPIMSNELLEKLAEAEHERWAHWQRYMHSKAIRNSDGSLTIPPELVGRWERLMETPYSDLTEDERESDREQVQRYLPLLVKLAKR